MICNGILGTARHFSLYFEKHPGNNLFFIMHVTASLVAMLFVIVKVVQDGCMVITTKLVIL